jgi:glyoxylase-like metal-dependent hydrolase (beta-lactamase superfamily II)
MRNARIGVLFLVMLAVALPAVGQSFDIIKVADGVYAAIGRGNVASNGAFIVNKDDVLVVDTHYRPSWARDLIAEIKKVTDKPVRYVENTHWHNDHVQGNQSYVNVFGPNVEYLAQHFTRDDMVNKAIPSIAQSLDEANPQGVPQAISRMERSLAEGKTQEGKPLSDEQKSQLQRQLADRKAYFAELKQIQLTLPTITFEKSLILHKPDRDIHVYFLGRGHTRGDVVVFLPKEKVLITGDLLTNGIPFMRDAYPSLWIGTLEAMERLDWQQAIPGHGQVQPDKAPIRNLITYMKDMVGAVRDSIGKGMSQEEARAKIDLSKYAKSFAGYPDTPQGQQNFQGASGSAINRTYLELTGKIPD